MNDNLIGVFRKKVAMSYDKTYIDEKGNVFRENLFGNPTQTSQRDTYYGTPNYERDALGFRQEVREKGEHGETLYKHNSDESSSVPGAGAGIAILLILAIILLIVLFLSPIIFGIWLLKKGVKTRPPYQLWLFIGICSFMPISVTIADWIFGWYQYLYWYPSLYFPIIIITTWELIKTNRNNWRNIQLSPKLKIRLLFSKLIPIIAICVWFLWIIIIGGLDQYPFNRINYWIIGLLLIPSLIIFIFNVFFSTFYSIDISVEACIPLFLFSIASLFLFYFLIYKDLIAAASGFVFYITHALLIVIFTGLLGRLGVLLRNKFSEKTNKRINMTTDQATQSSEIYSQAPIPGHNRSSINGENGF